MGTISRPLHECEVRTRNPVVALLGARQVGKTTLARAVADTWRGRTHVFDLEDRDDLAALADAPRPRPVYPSGLSGVAGTSLRAFWRRVEGQRTTRAA